MTSNEARLASKSPRRSPRTRPAARALEVLGDAGSRWLSTTSVAGIVARHPRRAPVDAVKLDRPFVRGVGTDLDDDTIVASVIRLAHARDLYVVAEGIGSWAEGARLFELGCDRAFGYLFCPPQRRSGRGGC